MPAKAEWECGRCEPGEEGGRGDTGQGRRDGGTWKCSDLPHSHLLLLVLSSPGVGPGSEDHREPSGMAGVEEPASSPPHTHTHICYHPTQTHRDGKQAFYLLPGYKVTRSAVPSCPLLIHLFLAVPSFPREPTGQSGHRKEAALAQEGSRPPTGHFLSMVGVV